MQLLEEEVVFPAQRSRMLVIACGAIAKELLEVIRLNRLDHITVECLPGKLHNTPDQIAPGVAAKLRSAGGYDKVFVAYADCGTGGRLDRVLEGTGIERIPGAHCYEFFAGSGAFAAIHEEEPGTFYLTDFLCRHFDRFVIEGLKLDRYPQLLSQIFGNYRRLIYIAQTDSSELVEKGRLAAEYLGLEYEVRRTGYGDLAASLIRFVKRAS
jgi:hypothetical protein